MHKWTRQLCYFNPHSTFLSVNLHKGPHIHILRGTIIKSLSFFFFLLLPGISLRTISDVILNLWNLKHVLKSVEQSRFLPNKIAASFSNSSFQFFPQHVLTKMSQNKLAAVDLFGNECFSFLPSPVPKTLSAGSFKYKMPVICCPLLHEECFELLLFAVGACLWIFHGIVGFCGKVFLTFMFWDLPMFH